MMKTTMVNTRILKTEFEYLVPENLLEALHLLDKYGPKAKIIAGGTDLLVQMKQEVISPSYLMNIMKIPGMSFIRAEEGGLRIGSATTWREILEFCAGDRKYAALDEAASSLGKVQVRNMATIGGNLCAASPAADSAPALLVLISRVKLASVKGERILPLEDFFKGVNRTALATNEILTEIQIPPFPSGMGSAFMKMTRVGADISKISCAVSLSRQGDFCTSCRVAMGAVAPVPLMIGGVQEITVGKKVEAALVEELGQHVAREIKPITDIRSTAEYRRNVAAILFQDVFWKAWQRAGGRGA